MKFNGITITPQTIRETREYFLDLFKDGENESTIFAIKTGRLDDTYTFKAEAAYLQKRKADNSK